jgi:hypothetical protein
MALVLIAIGAGGVRGCGLIRPRIFNIVAAAPVTTRISGDFFSNFRFGIGCKTDGHLDRDHDHD